MGSPFQPGCACSGTGTLYGTPLNLEALHCLKKKWLRKTHTIDMRIDCPDGSNSRGGRASSVENERLSREMEQPILNPETRKSNDTLEENKLEVARLGIQIEITS